MLGRKEMGEGVEGVLSFREAIWARMAELGIGSPNALATLLNGRVSHEALYSYLCEGTEFPADKLEAVFNVLGIRLYVLPTPGKATDATACKCRLL